MAKNTRSMSGAKNLLVSLLPSASHFPGKLCRGPGLQGKRRITKEISACRGRCTAQFPLTHLPPVIHQFHFSRRHPGTVILHQHHRRPVFDAQKVFIFPGVRQIPHRGRILDPLDAGRIGIYVRVRIFEDQHPVSHCACANRCRQQWQDCFFHRSFPPGLSAYFPPLHIGIHCDIL
jgi:hypothetical protein